MIILSLEALSLEDEKDYIYRVRQNFIYGVRQNFRGQNLFYKTYVGCFAKYLLPASRCLQISRKIHNLGHHMC